MLTPIDNATFVEDLRLELAESVRHKIVDTFNCLGGDPSTATKSAQHHASIWTWKMSQAGQAGLAGAAAMAVPGPHAIMILPDILFLIHKMAYCCWGIGALHGCTIETKADFSVILAIYTGVVTEDVLEWSVVGGSVTGVGLYAAHIGVPAFAGKLTGSAVSVAAGNAGGVLSSFGPLISVVAEKFAAKLTAKIMTKVAWKATAKSASDLVSGCVPCIGPIAAGAINAYFVYSIADAAEKYYAAKKAANQMGS